jgi:hypothetical protein
LQNVILRDSADVGLQVGSAGSADLISATVLKNGTGVLTTGTAHVRNCIVTANDVGLAGAAAGQLDTRYNDVFGNRSDDFRNARAATTDLAAPVSFEAGFDGDLRLPHGQATTDQGDPADEYAQEPAPNGKRINLGAFGNTEFAELSALAPPEVPPVDQPGTDPRAVPTPAAVSGGGDDGGCGIAPGRAAQGPRWMLPLAGLALMMVRRRRP